MATISSAGLGSGLDINGIITKLMEVESQPLKALAVKEASYQAKISAYGSVKSSLGSLQSAVEKLADADTYSAFSASSTDMDIVDVSLSGTPNGTGNYSVTVNQLAKYHTLRTNGNYTASSDTFNTGTLSISINGGTAVDITIDSSNNTLSGIRDAINDADAGVTASIVSDGTYQRLILTSQTLGSSGDIDVSVTDSGSGGSFALSDFATANLVTLQGADDAELVINGLTITRSSNTVSDAIEGVTLELTATGSATVKVAPDTASVVSAFDDFVSAFNEAKQQIASLTQYNAETGQGSVLTGDATLRNLQSRLNQLVFSSVSDITGDIASLSDLGITLQDDGTLSLDTATLTSMLNDENVDVVSLMTQTTDGNEGIAVSFDTTLTAWLETDGLIDSRTEGIQASIEALQDRYETMERRLKDIEERYRAQFSALDSLIASLNQTSQYLTQQLANLPKINS